MDDQPQKQCSTCFRGYKRDDSEKIVCGAPFEFYGKQPIWAARKSNPITILMIAAGKSSEIKNFDCDKMDGTDGATCEMWEAASAA